MLCDVVCRGLMLKMHRAGLITLPPVAHARHNPLAKRPAPEFIDIDAEPVQVRLAELQPLQISLVRRTVHEGLFHSLMHQHHYLGYARTVGEHLKYLVSAHGRPIVCLSWCSAARRLETFVDTERFRGTCYRAANWISLGRTAGRGVDAPSRASTTSIKEVLGYPLVRDFRERLRHIAAV